MSAVAVVNDEGQLVGEMDSNSLKMIGNAENENKPPLFFAVPFSSPIKPSENDSSFYQDRLGTSIQEKLKRQKRCLFVLFSMPPTGIQFSMLASPIWQCYELSGASMRQWNTTEAHTSRSDDAAELPPCTCTLAATMADMVCANGLFVPTFYSWPKR